MTTEYSRVAALLVNNTALSWEARETLRAELIEAGQYSRLSPSTRALYDKAKPHP